MTSDSTPAFEIEKEALKTEIETGIQAGVDHLEAKTAKRKDADKYHNTRHLLKQYRKVAYAIQISEADMNVRMEMEHGTRLSTLEVNAELAGVDLSGSKLEGYARTVIRSKNMLQIIDNALNTVRMDPDHGELMIPITQTTPRPLQASGFRRFSRSFVATAVRPLLPPRILATLIEAGSAKVS